MANYCSVLRKKAAAGGAQAARRQSKSPSPFYNPSPSPSPPQRSWGCSAFSFLLNSHWPPFDPLPSGRTSLDEVDRGLPGCQDRENTSGAGKG